MNFNIDFEKCQTKKQENITSHNLLKKHLSESAKTNNLQCGNLLTFLSNEDFSMQRLETGFFCKQNFCPACAWRKSLKNAIKIDTICKKALDDKKALIFITLTAPNVKGDNLDVEIRRYYRALDHLMKLKKYQCFEGVIKKLEVTYNKERDDYHPHYHLICFVGLDYFAGRNYISRKQLLKDWQKVMKDDSITQVDIKACKEINKHGTNAILEIAKYSAKSSDYTFNQEVFDVFYKSLKRKKVLTYQKVANEYSKLYQSKQLDYIKEPNQDKTVYTYRIFYNYYKSFYMQNDVKKIDARLYVDKENIVED